MQKDQHTQTATIQHFDFGQVENNHAGLFQAGHCVLQKMDCLTAHDSSGALQHGHVPRLLPLDM
jgi:hypothetical protein